MRNILLGALALAAASLSAMPAAAVSVDMIDFTLRSSSFPLVLHWQLPTSPTPDVTDPEDENFDPNAFDLTGPFFGGVSFLGSGGPAVFLGFTFYTDEGGGGLSTGGSADLGDIFPEFVIPFGFDLTGPQLFTGDTLHPTFKPGHYGLFTGGCGCGPAAASFEPDFRLTIGPDSGGAPEPAAWALMIAGFGLAGAALRRRRVLA